MDSWHFILALIAMAGWMALVTIVLGNRQIIATHKEHASEWKKDSEHLRKLLALRDAPKEEQWMSAEDFPPQFPENARYDESGLYYVIEDTDGKQ